MRIGFTYDLKEQYLAEGFSPEQAAEFDKPETIAGIEQAIVRQGHEVDRIGNLRDLAKRLAGGDRWDLVFNIAEGMYGMGREAQVPAVLEGYGIPAVFGDSLCLAVCLHKGYAKHIVRASGVPTPDFLVVESKNIDVSALSLTYPLFAKPVAEGTGKGVTAKGKIMTPAALVDVCGDLLERFNQPVLVEEYLPGREFTVGIIGTGDAARIAGIMEVALLDNAERGAYTFENKDKYEDRVSYRLAESDDEAREAGRIAIAAHRALGCRDASRVDIRSDANGAPHFMEANPLAGLNPEHSDLPILCRLKGIGFDQLIADILASAMRRVRP
jgi:D-alanine-D-alanine ligase and related ATP-grasp enzymes